MTWQRSAERYSRNYKFRRPYENACYSLTKFACGLFNCFFDFNVSGDENIPEAGAVLASNHCISLDGILVAINVRRPIHFLVQYEDVYDSWLKPLIWSVGLIPIRTYSANLEPCSLKFGFNVYGKVVSYLVNGELVGIFPEGPARNISIEAEESKDSLEKRVLYRSVAHISHSHKVPIIPISLSTPQEIRENLFGISGRFRESFFYIVKHRKANGKIPYFIDIKKRIDPGFYNGVTKAKAVTEITEDLRLELFKLAKK